MDNLTDISSILYDNCGCDCPCKFEVSLKRMILVLDIIYPDISWIHQIASTTYPDCLCSNERLALQITDKFKFLKLYSCECLPPCEHVKEALKNLISNENMFKDDLENINDQKTICDDEKCRNNRSVLKRIFDLKNWMINIFWPQKNEKYY